ncbi:hypothetical protein [Streptomyces sp. NPDC058394]|uniref:hypothetical protein n=1 Tax=Streptomyces sp. NPDC058394 TaxID=3346477 RepID=UPI003669013D
MIAALDLYMESHPFGTLPRQADTQLMPEGDTVPLGLWMHHAKDRGIKDSGREISAAFQRHGFNSTYANGRVQLTTPSAYTHVLDTRTMITALDRYMESHPSGTLPRQAATQVMPEGNTVPLGQWMHSVKNQGIKDPRGEIAAALQRHGFQPIYRENAQDLAGFTVPSETATAAMTTPISTQTQSTAHLAARNNTASWTAWQPSSGPDNPSRSRA